MNTRPTGSPRTSPDGTVMLGVPATAAMPEPAPEKWSPLTWSVGQAGDVLGAMMASRPCWSIAASRPCSPA